MNGFFNVLKPSGITSSDVVVALRRILQTVTGKRLTVGHLGTLDPLGAGVLPVAVGSASKLFNYMLEKSKLYRAKFIFGSTTDTLDAAGKLTVTTEPDVTREKLEAVLPKFIGNIMQIPPQYSSKSVDGVRAYKLARQGVVVELKGKAVDIYGITIVEGRRNEFVLDIACGSGTYIRSLCRDMAEALDTVAYMASIIRLENGSFNIENSKTLFEIQTNIDDCFVPINRFGGTLPCYKADIELKKSIDNGVKLKLKAMPDGLFELLIDGKPYGIAVKENSCLKVILRYDKESA